MLAKGVTEALRVEPPSQEDIEVALIEPDESLLRTVLLSTESMQSSSPHW
jgi:hypothetical protein